MELIVDNFAGGGGASTGIERAIGRPIDIAINHDAAAIAMHKANHPHTRHFCEDIWQVDPAVATQGRPVGLAWFSPDCKHFSKAKGGKPVSKRVRGLAWVAIRWAKAVKPRIIMLENVEEFATWGPLLEDGRPCPERRGLTYRRWIRQLENLGYKVETRELRACDYGAPTSRKRLFLIARRDGQPIVWPKPSHGPGRIPYRTAAECIDWSLPCPSIFERSRELKPATLRRIARGIMKYVVNSPKPFIVSIAHGDSGGRREYPISEPLGTVSAGGIQHAVVAPTLVQTGWGERQGQAPRSLDLFKPLGTVMADGTKHALVAAFLARHYGGNENDGSSMTQPMFTVTATDHHALVASHLVKLRNNQFGQALNEPIGTLTAGGGHYGEVRAFLLKYYGTDQDPQLGLPLHTITTKDRFGLVMVHGEQYIITDIGMRMLAPRELFTAQGFPTTYKIDPMFEGRLLTKSAQVRCCGNSVNPDTAEALVDANYFEQLAAQVA